MPVRIYDLAKKLGMESKDVLAKAKELGIAAKVPSSSLDKITAEFLEQHLEALRKPEVPVPAPAPPIAPTPIILVSDPPPEVLPILPTPAAPETPAPVVMDAPSLVEAEEK